MDISSALQSAEGLLNRWTSGMSTPDIYRLDVVIQSRELKPAIKQLVESRWGYLSAMTGLDHPPVLAAPEDKKPSAEGMLEVLYHFCEGAAIVTLRVSVPYSRPEIPSICDIVVYASLYEREIIELFGITFTGTPNTDRLVLPDEWPVGVYPLRKSFTSLKDIPQV
jgi:Ni,Fe-hydrogenase III component G